MTTPIANRPPIVADRVRTIHGQTFAFLPHRFLRDGFLTSMGAEELRLYVFLVLAADRNGISYYSYERICSLLEIDLNDYLEARNSLVRRDLIAFDGTRFQVLSLPQKPIWKQSEPLRTTEQMENSDPATVRQLICSSFLSDPRAK